MSSASMVGMSFLVLGVILLMGKWIRVVSPSLQKLFIPSSLIGGFLALFLGSEVLGKIVSSAGYYGTFISGGLFPQEMIDIWSALPGLLST
ncbi:MAG: hypothetical protein R2741_07610 [Methanolobus sp.]